jgi:hypothetical protein
MDDGVFRLVAQALLAVFGALARQLHLKGKHGMQAVSFVSGCAIAAFSGIIVHFLADAFNLGVNLSYALSGLIGWAGPQALDAIVGLAGKKLGLGAGLDAKQGDETAKKEADEKRAD